MFTLKPSFKHPGWVLVGVALWLDLGLMLSAVAKTAPAPAVFIIDCPRCQTKVAAHEKGRAVGQSVDPASGTVCTKLLVVGCCPVCDEPLVGAALQEPGADPTGAVRWSDMTRVHPQPARVPSSEHVPAVVRATLEEAERAMQVHAYTAACVMFGRALEGVLHDVLSRAAGANGATLPPPRQLMMAESLRLMKEWDLLDPRLYEWCKELHGFRNLAAHPTDVVITREDATDLQALVYAIVEYTYDMTDHLNALHQRTTRQPAAGPDSP